jgi:hypothetical protein
MWKALLGACLLTLVPIGTAGAGVDSPPAVLARFKAVTGGAGWDALKTLQTSGKLQAGGLDGTFDATQDLLTGRSVNSYELGPIRGGEGYDGTHGWTRDPGGEVAAHDAPEARRRARSQAWLDARAFWYPERIPATYGAATTRELDGDAYTVLVATPHAGDPVTLWFDEESGLLTRVVQVQDQDTATTTYSDWREVDGLRFPFRSVTDVTDAAGRTDMRQRTDVTVTRYRLNVAVNEVEFALPKMADTAHIEGGKTTTRIPFELINNHIHVHGEIDGKPARFLVDTGGVNLLTAAAAKKFGIAGHGKLSVRGVGDKPADLAFARAGQVRVGDAVLDDPVFYVVDLGDLPKVEGVICDGLVGYEMFRRFGVTIDYAKHVLTLSDPKSFTPPAGAHAVPFDLADRIPMVQGQLDGLPVRLSIDTGSRASLSLFSPFVRKHDLVTRYSAAPEAVTGWGVGGPSRSRPARFGNLELGGFAIGGIAGDLYTGDKGAFASPDAAGNLGGGVLNRFTVAFDYAGRRMYLAPNADFARPDNFDRSGLWLFGDGDALKVVDVAPDSAARHAGLRNGDRITAIGDEPVTSRILTEWRQRLRDLPAGTRLAIEFQRDAKSATVVLVLADRIPATSPADGTQPADHSGQ